MGASPPPTETTGLVAGGADKPAPPRRPLIWSQLVVAAVALALLGCVCFALVLIYHVRPADQVRPPAYAFALKIVHLNDHHSHIEETRLAVPITDNAGVTAAVGGWPRLVTLLRQLSAEHPNLLKLHAGDAITGTLWYTIFKGGADAAVMRMACLDAYGLGNHEFDNGDAALAHFIDALRTDASSLYPSLLSTPADFSWTRIEDEWKRIPGVAPIDRERNFLASLMRMGAARANATRSSSSSSSSSSGGGGGGGGGAATDADDDFDVDAAVAEAAAIAHAGAPVCAPPAVLCANLRPAASSPLKGKVAPYEVFERSGERIGVVGLDTSAKVMNASNPDRGTRMLEVESVAQKNIDELTAQGVNKVVLVTHHGYEEDLLLAKTLRGVDVIVGGDSHSLLKLDAVDNLGLNTVGPYPTLVRPARGGSPVCVVQAWEYAHLVGLLTVEFDEGGVVQNCNGELIMPVGRGSFREPAFAASDEACPGHPNIKRRSSACPQKLRDDKEREQRQRPEQQRDQKLRAVAGPAPPAQATADEDEEACPGHPHIKRSSEACLSFADGDEEEDDLILADDDSVTVGSGPTAQHIVARALKTYPVLRPTPADEAAAALVSALRMRLDNATHTAVASFARPICFDRFPGQGLSTLCPRARTYKHGGEVGNLVARAMLEAEPRAVLALQNAGGARRDIAEGVFTMADAYELLPFGETLVLMQLKGSEIATLLEQVLAHSISGGGGTGGYPYASGLRFAVDGSAREGRRISGLEVNARLQAKAGWTAIDPKATYAVVTNNFIAGGKDGYALLGEVSAGERREDTYNDQTQAFVNYVSSFEGEVPGLPDDEVSTTRFVSRAGCDHSETPDCGPTQMPLPEPGRHSSRLSSRLI